jgi:prepilin-type N-terminal cleavage/methylation domain-containing protein/prepilin-type processing-associated H-X9-DG protein
MRASANIRGFSFTELMVVLAVIAVLAALLIAGLGSAQTEALRLKCQHRLEQIGNAFQMYISANHGQLPELVNYQSQPWYMTLARGGYVDNPALIACPVEDDNLTTVVEPTETAADLLEGLRWLSRVQNEGTGGWDWEAPAGNDASDAISGLALYAFLTSGCSDTAPPDFAETVKSATEYLIDRSDNGAYYRGTSTCMYTIGICTMALARAAAMIEDPALKEEARQAAEDGLIFMAGRQHSSLGGWSYSSGGHDISITGWCFEAIAQAKTAGISLPADLDTETFFRRCIRENRHHCNDVRCSSSTCGWAATVTDHNTWYEYVVSRTRKCPDCNSIDNRHIVPCWLGGAEFLIGGKCPNCGDVVTRYPPPPSEYGTGYSYGAWYSNGYLTGTAIALGCRGLMGESSASVASQGALQYLIDANYLNQGNSTYYIIYYLTLAMGEIGGSYWESWDAAFRPNLLARQIKEGDDKGSWPINNYWSSNRGGKVYATAMSIVSLERSADHHWARRIATGQNTYGYNSRLGKDRRTLTRGTVVVMDYSKWAIDRGDEDIKGDDTIHDIAPRHGGRANVLLGDLSVKAFRPDEITDGMWTPDPHD